MVCSGQVVPIPVRSTDLLRLHPVYFVRYNAKNEERITYSKFSDVKVIRSLSELQNCNPIFINLKSAAYYDFRYDGPFIFVEDEIIPLSVMFEDDIMSVSTDRLLSELTKYFYWDYWNGKRLAYC